MNPIMQMLNRQSSPVAPTQMSGSNPIQMIQQFQQFRQQMAGKNPQQMINDLIQSGQMSKDQFSRLENQARSIMGMFGR